MICTTCKTECVTGRLDSDTFDTVELGRVRLTDVDLLVCSCGATKNYTAEQSKTLDARLARGVGLVLGRLPIGMFITRSEAFAIVGDDKKKRALLSRRKRVLSRKLDDGFVFYYRPSVETFHSTGDGRLNLIAELAKHEVLARMSSQNRPVLALDV